MTCFKDKIHTDVRGGICKLMDSQEDGMSYSCILLNFVEPYRR